MVTDASLAPGMSGGPVLDCGAAVLGMASYVVPPMRGLGEGLPQGWRAGDSKISPYLRHIRNLKPVYKLNTGGGAAKYGEILLSTPLSTQQFSPRVWWLRRPKFFLYIRST